MNTAKVHPLTQERLNRLSAVGRAMHEYGQAMYLRGKREVTDAYVDRKRGEYKQKLQYLVEAAQEEGLNGVSLSDHRISLIIEVCTTADLTLREMHERIREVVTGGD